MDMPNYEESVRIGWSVLWRAVGGFLFLLFAINLALLFLVPELRRAEPSLWASLVPLLVATLVSLAFIMPLVVRMLLTKSFRGFRLRFVRVPDAAPQAVDRGDHDRGHVSEPSARRA